MATSVQKHEQGAEGQGPGPHLSSLFMKLTSLTEIEIEPITFHIIKAGHF